jgi:hypothetical protein
MDRNGDMEIVGGSRLLKKKDPEGLTKDCHDERNWVVRVVSSAPGY